MARMKVRLDHDGIGRVLKSAEVAAAVSRIADEVATAANADPDVQRHAAGPTGMRVEVRDYTSRDRAASAVTLAGPDGVGVEAKYGPLGRAARAAGLGVRETHLHVKAGLRRRRAAESRAARKARRAELSKTRRGRVVLDSERRNAKTRSGRALKTYKTRQKARAKRKRKR